MDFFLTLLLFILLMYLGVRQVLKNLYGLVAIETNDRLAPAVILAAAVTLLTNLLDIGHFPERMLLCLSLVLLGLYSLTISILPAKWVRNISYAVVFVLFLYTLTALLERFIVKYTLGPVFLGYLISAICCLSSVVFLVGVYERLSDIKYVMRSASVWATVCLYMDAVYAVLIVILAVGTTVFNTYAAIAGMLFLILALSQRIYRSSVFVLFVRHERRIIESMKVAHAETASETPGADQLYTNIYERLLGYFEKHKPYLKSDLTINDIVDVVYTNKLYISKAISHCTGRNFCQFVNYYRITHAVELFRADPTLKVVDLSERSGFNSTTSFSAAFRLYMGEKPGDWCRIERGRLIKK